MKLRTYFQNSREPFIIQVAGQRLVITTASEDVAQMFTSDELSFNGIMKILHRDVANISEDGVSTIWRKPEEGFESLFPNPKKQALVHTGRNLFHKQALQGGLLEDLTDRFLGRVEKSTRWDSFFPGTVVASEDKERIVSLHRWALEVLLDAATGAFYGESMTKVLPDIASIFDEWDQNAFLVAYRYPDFLARAATVPRDRIVDAIARYYELPPEQRSDAVPYVFQQEDECRHAGLSNLDSAKLMMMLYWA